jgi:hypothetical protein
MSRMIPIVVAGLVSVCLAGQAFMSQAFAQLTPPAGSAGAGMAPINGIPYGPANPRPASDPSGIGNASGLPPLRANTPYITTPQPPLAPARTAAPVYPSASQQIISAQAIEARRKSRHHRPPRRQVSSFAGICRGC